MSNAIISAHEFVRRVPDANTIVIDARSGPDAKEKYQASHISKAQFVDLERDLSTKTVNPAQGGRHPLPDIKQFAITLGNLGIKPSSFVYVYDDKSGANAAARFWWMLRACGHENVWVIDGGFQSAVSAGAATSSMSNSVPSASPYPVDKWLLPTVLLTDVTKASSGEDQTIIDVRENFRYRGERESIDLTAGHIPSAINIPYSNNLDENGLFLSPEKLREKYAGVFQNKPVSETIVHCGSGVTACHTLLALEHAGFKGAKLYVGSWSEWSRNDLPIEKEV